MRSAVVVTRVQRRCNGGVGSGAVGWRNRYISDTAIFTPEAALQVPACVHGAEDAARERVCTRSRRSHGVLEIHCG